MDLLKELVKLADELDKQGHTVLADKIDSIVKMAAEKKEKGMGEPVLKMKVRKSDDDDGSYDVTVYAPSGLSPYDPVVHAYIKKYGPFGEDGVNLDYCETLANSMPHEPNMFRYRLRGPSGPGKGPAIALPAAAAALPAMLGADTVESLLKIANELDSAGALDLADKIDSLLKQ